jgi:Ca-activated chloride channel family protein
VVKAVSVVLLLAIATAGVAGQGSSGRQDSSTFKAAVDLVALNVVVVDTKQQFVGGLTADNFVIYEDGVQQDVSFFAADEMPLDLAMLLDTSASMHDKLATAQLAAVRFASALRPVDRALVVDVKDTSRILAPLSHDLNAARAAILSTAARGGTALYNGLYTTLKEMTRQRRGETDRRRQALVVLSDGDDTSSLVSFDDVMELARQSEISIYTIMLNSSAVRDLIDRRGSALFSKSDYAMRALAQETGARSFSVIDVNDLAGAYSSIGHDLTNQYALGYTSSNPRRDGAYRRVSVRIVDRAGAQPRTRAGYFGPKA